MGRMADDCAYTCLNGDWLVGKAGFPPAEPGIQEIVVTFPTPMRGEPKVFALWRDSLNTFIHVDGLVITETSNNGFKIATNRLTKNMSNWWFCYFAIYK